LRHIRQISHEQNIRARTAGAVNGCVTCAKKIAWRRQSVETAIAGNDLCTRILLKTGQAVQIPAAHTLERRLI
jgi:hypothetical protein